MSSLANARASADPAARAAPSSAPAARSAQRGGPSVPAVAPGASQQTTVSSKKYATLLAKYRERGDLLTRWQDSHGKWKARAKELEESNALLVTERDNLSYQVEELETAIAQKVADVASLQSVVQNLKAGNSALSEELRAARLQIKGLRAGSKGLEETIEELENPSVVWSLYHCDRCNCYEWASHPRGESHPQVNHRCERTKGRVEPLDWERTDPSDNDVAWLERQGNTDIYGPDEEE